MKSVSRSRENWPSHGAINKAINDDNNNNNSSNNNKTNNDDWRTLVRLRGLEKSQPGATNKYPHFEIFLVA